MRFLVKRKLCVPSATTISAYTTMTGTHVLIDSNRWESPQSGFICACEKCPAESAEEITRRIAEMVARDL